MHIINKKEVFLCQIVLNVHLVCAIVLIIYLKIAGIIDVISEEMISKTTTKIEETIAETEEMIGEMTAETEEMIGETTTETEKTIGEMIVETEEMTDMIIMIIDIGDNMKGVLRYPFFFIFVLFY